MGSRSAATFTQEKMDNSEDTEPLAWPGLRAVGSFALSAWGRDSLFTGPRVTVLRGETSPLVRAAASGCARALGVLVTPATFPVLCAMPGRLLNVAPGLGADVGWGWLLKAVVQDRCSRTTRVLGRLSLQIPICSEPPFNETLRENTKSTLSFKVRKKCTSTEYLPKGNEGKKPCKMTVSTANDVRSPEEMKVLTLGYVDKNRRLTPRVNGQSPPPATVPAASQAVELASQAPFSSG